MKNVENLIKIYKKLMKSQDFNTFLSHQTSKSPKEEKCSSFFEKKALCTKMWQCFKIQTLSFATDFKYM